MVRRWAKEYALSDSHISIKLKYDPSGANVLKHFRRGKFVKTLRF